MADAPERRATLATEGLALLASSHRDRLENRPFTLQEFATRLTLRFVYDIPADWAHTDERVPSMADDAEERKSARWPKERRRWLILSRGCRSSKGGT
jgi:hypothetical protein